MFKKFKVENDIIAFKVLLMIQHTKHFWNLFFGIAIRAIFDCFTTSFLLLKREPNEVNSMAVVWYSFHS